MATMNIEPSQMNRIRYSHPRIVGRELSYLRDVLESPHFASDGAFSARCRREIAQSIGADRVELVQSATVGLELACLLAHLQPGDEVVMPSYTFVSCANAVVLRGAVPVFVDIDHRTLNVDPSAVAQAISDRTRAILAVHYAGIPCDMDALREIADRHELMLIEDAAQAYMSYYRGRAAGTLGDVGVFSFHDTKNLTSGEGGAVLINREQLFKRADVLLKNGTDRTSFERGERAKYQWIDVGSSFMPSEITCAVLLAQLEEALRVTDSRRAMWQRYHDAFKVLEDRELIERPHVPGDVRHNGHLYAVRFRNGAMRDPFIAGMKSIGITTPFHFVPLHSSPGGRKYGRVSGDLSVTDAASQSLVRLPLWIGMEGVQGRVVEAVLAQIET